MVMQYEFDGRTPVISSTAYVSDLATVIGDVVIAENCYIGHGAILRGDYGRIEIGPGTAVEEGVIIHAPPEHVSQIGQKVTLGHGAIIHGTRIADFAVIGMGAILSIWSEVGEWAIVAEGAIVKLGSAFRITWLPPETRRPSFAISAARTRNCGITANSSISIWRLNIYGQGFTAFQRIIM
jgi:carbonic anhydrase/acetyltransferase-like protein (isoleucine patch superfamily)